MSPDMCEKYAAPLHSGLANPADRGCKFLYHTTSCPIQEQDHLLIASMKLAALKNWEQHFFRGTFAGTALWASHQPEHSCCTFSTVTFLLLPYTLPWNILAVRSVLEHSYCYPISSTGTFLLYVLYRNILAVILYTPLEYSCCYPVPSTGTSLLLPYTLHWNILAVRSLLEHSCCFPIPSTGTFLLLPYTLHWNILLVILYTPPEYSCCYPIPSLHWNILAVTVHPPLFR